VNVKQSVINETIMNKEEYVIKVQDRIDKAMTAESYHTFQINRAAERAIIAAGEYLKSENADILKRHEKELIEHALRRSLSMMSYSTHISKSFSGGFS
jgi:hypothetical protein